MVLARPLEVVRAGTELPSPELNPSLYRRLASECQGGCDSGIQLPAAGQIRRAVQWISVAV